MTTLAEAVHAFLASDRIAVAGVSRDPRQAANAIYRKLRSTGHNVVAVNPRADVVEGDPCYPTLRDVPGQVDAVVVVTPAGAALDVMRQCQECGVSRVWLHRGIGAGGVSAEAVAYGRERGLAVIPGACPMMYLAPVDLAHRCVHRVLGWLGKLPTVARTRPPGSPP